MRTWIRERGREAKAYQINPLKRARVFYDGLDPASFLLAEPSPIVPQLELPDQTTAFLTCGDRSKGLTEREHLKLLGLGLSTSRVESVSYRHAAVQRRQENAVEVAGGGDEGRQIVGLETSRTLLDEFVGQVDEAHRCREGRGVVTGRDRGYARLSIRGRVDRPRKGKID